MIRAAKKLLNMLPNQAGYFEQEQELYELSKQVVDIKESGDMPAFTFVALKD